MAPEPGGEWNWCFGSIVGDEKYDAWRHVHFDIFYFDFILFSFSVSLKAKTIISLVFW